MGRAIVKAQTSGAGRIIVLPDIQTASAAGHDVLASMIDFIVQRRPDLVISVGDLTDYGGSFYADWATVQSAFKRLTEAGIDWAVAIGNHDYSSHATRATEANNYLASPGGWTLETPGHIENAYGVKTFGSRQWLVICLEWSPRTAIVDWAKTVLDEHADLPTIIVTHAYLYLDGTRYDWGTKRTSQAGNPHAPGLETTPAEGIHDGQELWAEIIADRPQVHLVLCGHSSPMVGPTVLTSTRVDGSKCHQLIQDYQTEAPFGGGWLVEYDIDSDNGRVYSRTYSPFLRESRYGAAANDHSLELAPWHA